jgi:hypothetical protein
MSAVLLLLQVPKEQWHTVAAIQAMVDNLAAEREAVVAFLHTIVDEVRGDRYRRPLPLTRQDQARVFGQSLRQKTQG